MGRCRVGLIGMVLTDWLVLGGFALILSALFLIHRATMILMAQLLEEIDHRVAEAIKAVVQDLNIEGMEPPNPIQQIVAQVLQQKLGDQRIPRDMKGQFERVIEIDADS